MLSSVTIVCCLYLLTLLTHESKDEKRVVQDQTVPILFDQKGFKAFQQKTKQ